MSVMKSAWIDITVPLRSGLVHWPGDPEARIAQAMWLERGDPYNLTTLSMSAHTGTHMDAPRHFVPDGETIDAVPISTLVGPARVIETRDPVAIRPEELRRHRIRPGERILFKTAGCARRWSTDAFDEDFVYIAKDAAAHLAERRVSLVGIDYLSVGGFQEDAEETHRILLGAGIWIVEGLNLSKVKSGRYDLICLPLRLAGADGAPARAVLRKRTR